MEWEIGRQRKCNRSSKNTGWPYWLVQDTVPHYRFHLYDVVEDFDVLQDGYRIDNAYEHNFIEYCKIDSTLGKSMEFLRLDLIQKDSAHMELILIQYYFPTVSLKHGTLNKKDLYGFV